MKIKVFVLLMIFYLIRIESSFSNDISVLENNLSTANSMIDSARLSIHGNANLSIVYCQKAIKIADSINSPGVSDVKIAAHDLLGRIYLNQGEYERSLGHYFELLKLINNDAKKMLIRASTYNNIGEVMRLSKNQKEAKEYHIRALSVYKRAGNKNGIANTYNNLGLIYEMINSLDSALYFHHKSLELKKEMKDTMGIADSYSNIGTIYKKQGNIDMSIKLQTMVLYIDEQQNNEVNIAISCNNIGVLYMETGDFEKAKKYLDRALQLAIDNNAKDIIKYSNQQLSILYEKTNDYKKSLAYYRNYTLYKDSLFNESKSKEIGRIEARYEIEKKQKEEAMIAEEKARQAEILKSRRENMQYSIILVGIVAIFGLILTMGFVKVSPIIVEGLIFFSFLIFFEFLLVLVDPHLDQWTSGEPLYKLLLNALIAGGIFPMHAYFERVLKRRLLKKTSG